MGGKIEFDPWPTAPKSAASKSMQVTWQWLLRKKRKELAQLKELEKTEDFASLWPRQKAIIDEITAIEHSIKRT